MLARFALILGSVLNPDQRFSLGLAGDIQNCGSLNSSEQTQSTKAVRHRNWLPVPFRAMFWVYNRNIGDPCYRSTLRWNTDRPKPFNIQPNAYPSLARKDRQRIVAPTYLRSPQTITWNSILTINQQEETLTQKP